MEGATKAAGLDGLVLHELRHTAGSHAVDAGLALVEVADQLGHANVEMLARTNRHRTRPVVEGMAGIMEQVITPATTTPRGRPVGLFPPTRRPTRRRPNYRVRPQ